MEPREDAIVDIPPNRVKFFGTTGKMLLPCPATIAALIEQIPEHTVITTDRLRRKLADQFEVEATCPVTTQKALQVVACDSNPAVAYWRVLNTNGGLIARFPGGVEDQARRLNLEGFVIEMSGKTAKVKQFREYLVRFD